MEDFIVAMLNMIGGVGAGSVTAGLLSQAPETWNPALYQLACAHVGERGVPAVRVVGLVASEGAEA